MKWLVTFLVLTLVIFGVKAEELTTGNLLTNGNTLIEYIWIGEVLGDFPSWALKIAWKEQGYEVFTWLIDYMDETDEK